MLLALLVTLAGAAVSGRVIDADTHHTIGGARVVLVPAEPLANPVATSPRETMSDTSGHFTFDAVPPGRYRLDAMKKGFAPLIERSEAAFFDVAAEQTVDNAELVLRPGATIAGRIVDTTGNPRQRPVVSALRVGDAPAGPAIALTAQMAQTDETGAFMLQDLDDGSYLVIAAPEPQPLFAQSAAPPDGMVPAPTYYPGTARKEAAQIITLARGQAVDGLQFAMASAQGYHVSGVVVDKTGAPLSDAMILLMVDMRNGGTGSPVMARSDAHGIFRIEAVVPGTYRLMAKLPMGAGGVGAVGGVFVGGGSLGGPGVPPPPGTPPIGGMMAAPAVEITVGDGDVDGLRIVVPSRRVTQRVTSARVSCAC